MNDYAFLFGFCGLLEVVDGGCWRFVQLGYLFLYYILDLYRLRSEMISEIYEIDIRNAHK